MQITLIKQVVTELRGVRYRAQTCDACDGDRHALREDSRVRFFRDGVERLNIVGGANQVGRTNARTAVFQVVLVSGRGELAGVVEDSFVLGSLTNLLERRNGHGGQEADNDHDDHDFDKGETFLTGYIHIIGRSYD